jgi:hypothetical protein
MRVQLEGEARDIWTFSSSGNHSHSVTTPAHSHSVTVPAHSHSTTIPDHAHSVAIPEHSHDLQPGIFEYPNASAASRIVVDGAELSENGTSVDRLDLISYLSMSGGKVTRGWHTVEIYPNDLARIEAQVTLREFIRSQLGDTY